MRNQTPDQTKQENPWLNLIFNVALPVYILNQLSKKLGEDGPLIALIFALALPLGYGIYDFALRKKMNAISVLGFLNVAFTGGFAILKLDGHWFAVKEGFFPLLIGIAVLGSNLFGKPFLQTLFWNASVFHLQKIEEALAERGEHPSLHSVFRRGTYFFALSFLFSAIANYVLATNVFASIDQSLSPSQQSEILNQQIAKMTYQGYIVIALPMTLFMAGILWYIIQKLTKLTGLKLDEILNQK
jgi:hypothetical protein